MSTTRIDWNIGGFRGGLGALARRSDVATARAVTEGAHLVQRQGMVFSSGRPGPNVRTGAHRRSWTVVGPTKSAAGWEARVGPTMVYSRALELGHPRWGGAKYPSLGPAMRWALGGPLAAVFVREWRAGLG